MTDPSFEVLLQHESFLRALARRLLADEHLAADALQETWSAALAAPPRVGPGLRGWLAAVLRNQVGKARRGAQRRQDRERRAPAPPAPLSTEEIVHREQVRRHLLEAVLGLPEPSRTALLLRYYHDWSAARIAAWLAVPVETVRTRVKRSIHELRRRLQDTAGEDRDWRLALLPVLGLRPGAGAAGAALPLAPCSVGGLTLMSLSSKVVLGAAFLGVSWLGWQTLRQAEPGSPATLQPPTASAGVPSGAATAGEAAPPASPPSPERSLEEVVATGAPRGGDSPGTLPAVPAAPAATLRVRVVDRPGTPLAGCEVQVSPLDGGSVAERDVLTDASGVAGFVASAGRYDVGVDEDGWYCERSPVLLPGPPEVVEMELNVERMSRVLGRVEDHRGRPLAGATVGAFARWTDASGQPHRWSSERRASDISGAYLLDEVVYREGVDFVIRAQHPEYLDTPEVPVTLVRAATAEADVLRFREPGAGVCGRVVGADGTPAASAQLRLSSPPSGEGVRAGVTGEQGEYRFTGLPRGAYQLEVWGPAGLQRCPVLLEREGEMLELPPLVLEAPVYRCTGTIRAPGGEPAAFARLSLEAAGGPETVLLEVQADGEGAYTVAFAEPGPFRLRVRWAPPGEDHAGVDEAFPDFELDGSSRELHLRAPGLLFQFRDARTGEVLRAWRGFFTLFPPDDQGLPTAQATCRNGFTVSGSLLRWPPAEMLVRPGSWRFEIAIDGYRTTSLEHTLVLPLEGETLLTVTLEPQ